MDQLTHTSSSHLMASLVRDLLDFSVRNTSLAKMLNTVQRINLVIVLYLTYSREVGIVQDPILLCYTGNSM